MRAEQFMAPPVELLLQTWPLTNLVRGQRREALRRAWINTANGVAMRVLDVDEGRLPKNPRMAAQALMRATLEICEGVGLNRQELVEFFNDRAEAGEYGQPETTDDAIMRGFALLSVLCAERMRQTEDRREVA